jgi:PPOX class probable FMN-dependent enzyme
MSLATPLPRHFIESEEALRAIYPAPVDLIRRKQLDRLDRHCKRIIELSPLAMLATSGADGSCDVTPRGDAPGFVRVLDERHIVMPDRRGNNRIDAMRNIVANPSVGVLFIVPGVNDLLRVNGAARIVADDWLLSSLAVEGRAPTAAILVTVEEAYLHCGRAFKRARVWDPATFAPPGALPPLAVMLADQTQPSRAESELLSGSESAPLY